MLRDPSRFPGIEGVHQIHVPVADLDRATAFYRDVLGMNFLFTAPPGMSFFDCGGTRLLLGASEPGRETGASLLYYRVPDIVAAAARLEEAGVKLIAQPHCVHRGGGIELWLAEFRDSEGNLAALLSERPEGSAGA